MYFVRSSGRTGQSHCGLRLFARLQVPRLWYITGSV